MSLQSMVFGSVKRGSTFAVTGTLTAKLSQGANTGVAIGRRVTSGAAWSPHKLTSDRGFSEIDAYATIPILKRINNVGRGRLTVELIWNPSWWG